MNQFLRLCIVDFFFRLSYYISRTPLLPLFALALGAREKDIGVICAASTITGLMLKFHSGILADIIGRRIFILIGLTVGAVAPFLYTFVKGLQSLLLIRYFHGIATATYTPASQAATADVAEGRKGELFSYLSVVKIATKAVASFIGGAAIGYLVIPRERALTDYEALQGYYLIYTACGGLGILAFMIALFYLRGVDKPTSTERGSAPKKKVNITEEFEKGALEIITNKKLVITCSVDSAKGLAVGTLEAFLVIYAMKVANLNVIFATMLWVCLTGMSVFCKPIMGRLSDKYGRQQIIYIGMMLCALPLVAIAMVKSFPVLLVLSAIFGIGEAFVTGSTVAFAADLCRRERYGAAMGVFGTISEVGEAAGPMMAGFLIGWVGYSTTFGLFAIIMLAMTMLFEVKTKTTNGATAPKEVE
ncbi:MAG: hypothetical protein A2W23_05405 [Planctomycetes bacterium RBG_16_43_13]|nr:MAG: hypothetical protein A2W23_05405 [Planctomycetes bacterium RBG_16_43_13]